MSVCIMSNQINIFDILDNYGVEHFIHSGSNYVICNKNLISKKPIELGNKILYPGDKVNELGEKERTKFSMKERCFLKYEGKLNDESIILFSVYPYKKRNDKWDNCYYSFGYVDKNTLVVFNSKNSARDIRINKLEIFKPESEDKE